MHQKLWGAPVKPLALEIYHYVSIHPPCTFKYFLCPPAKVHKSEDVPEGTHIINIRIPPLKYWQSVYTTMFTNLI